MFISGLSFGHVVHMERENTRSSPLETVKSDWGYVAVREHANMFWWFFNHDPSFQPSFLGKIDPVPLIMWFQVKKMMWDIERGYSQWSPTYLTIYI